MNKTNLIKTAAIVAMGALLAMPTFAATTTSATSSSKKISKAETQEINLIDVRIDSLNKLTQRIQALENVSQEQKASISTQIQSLIQDLTVLKDKVATEASTTVLKTVRNDLTKDYRVYALAIPQLNILAGADRVVSITNGLNVVGMKIAARLQVNASSTASSTIALLTSYENKMVVARKLAEEAVAIVAPLIPDQGDKDTMKKNLDAMKSARAKLQEAQKQIVAVRKDADSLVKILQKEDKAAVEGLKNPKSASTSQATSTR